MAQRIELVTGPLVVWWAPDTEAFPAIDDAPAGNWAEIGSATSPEDGYSEDGVRILSDTTWNEFNSLGNIDPEMMYPTNRNLRVQLTMHDLSSAQIRAAFGFNAVTANANDNELSLVLPASPDTIAILVRGTGNSPDVDGDNLQFEFARCLEVGAKDLAFQKGNPAGALLEFRVLAGTQVLRIGD